jgi:hypothetical protein
LLLSRGFPVLAGSALRSGFTVIGSTGFGIRDMNLAIALPAYQEQSRISLIKSFGHSFSGVFIHVDPVFFFPGVLKNDNRQ